jgi:hypothetical protein
MARDLSEDAMAVGTAFLISWLLLAGRDMPVAVVQAPDSPVRLDHLKILNTGDEPLVLLYAATNLTGDQLDQFTVMVLVFNQQGGLKATQVAPGRRTLDAHETKYSAMVLDVGGIEPTDSLMVGVDQAQRAGSDQWWRANIRALAEETARRQKR